jgi:PAS domain S-box-containing protein
MDLPTFTLLIVEDLATDRELYRRALNQDSSCIYRLLEAESVAAGMELCRTRSIDAILLDYALPDADGLAFLAALHNQSNGSSPPVVMVTEMGDPRIAVRAMKLGAQDYLVKGDLTPELLQSTIRSAIENTHLRLELQQSNDRLQVKNQQITTIWESMTDAYITLDRDWRIIYANPRATEVVRQLVGLAPEEFLGKTHWEVFPWSVGNIIEQEYRRAVTDSPGERLRQRVAVHFEVLYEPTGSWFEIHAYPSDVGLGVYFRDINERKRGEELLRQSEELNRRIFNSSHDCIKVVDLAGRLIYMNDPGQPLMEIDDFSTVANSQWLEFWQGSERELARTAFSTALAGGVARFDGYCATAKGTPKWWEVIVTPILAADGQVSQILSVSRDITERKQAETALQIGEELFRSTFENTSIGLAHVSLDGTWIEVNQKLCAILGYSSAELLATTFQAITEPADLAEDLDLVQQLVNGEINEYTLEKRYIHRQGHHVWANLTVALIRTIATDGRLGIPQYFISAIQDITDRKHAERELKESEERLQTGIAVAGVGLARFDYATNLVALSPEAAALYGFAPNQLVVTREQIHATFHPDERAELEAIIAQVIDPAGTGWFARDHRVIWPTGEVRCLSVRKQVFFDRSGAVARPSYAILAAIDITDLKQTQADLEQRNQELDSFVHVVSHDLKAPLRGIANLSEWIEDDLEGSLSVANQEQMTLLRSRVYKMQATIDGLLDYARLGQLDETIESVAVAEVLAEVIDSLGYPLGTRIDPPPTFTIELPPEMPTLSTRRLPLFQIFANLIGNGIKHHDRPDGSIVISLEDRGDCYEFAIADDGPGIAPEHHERMFKIFQAVNPQNRSDSTGIGLAIVKKMVEAEGGTIWLESELGQGTTFYFTWLK